jgi:hypothetical protein
MPAADSAVLLILDPFGTYVSALNGKIISQGYYSITTNQANQYAPVLQLNNFKTTGIFSISIIFDSVTLHISQRYNDTFKCHHTRRLCKLYFCKKMIAYDLAVHSTQTNRFRQIPIPGADLCAIEKKFLFLKLS